MRDDQRSIAKACFEGAKTDALKFPDIVGRLIGAGFERYAVDFCRAAQTYYLPDGDSITFDMPCPASTMGTAFDTAAVQAAIREAQADAPGYSYAHFCEKVVAAGCVGYVVSFAGRRAVYYGRTADSHIEPFPR